MFYQKNHKLFVEETDVTTVLAAINRYQGVFSNNYKLVGSCGWDDEPTKWFVSFWTTDKKWGCMAADLSDIGEITVKVTPGGATELYFTRKG